MQRIAFERAETPARWIVATLALVVLLMVFVGTPVPAMAQEDAVAPAAAVPGADAAEVPKKRNYLTWAYESCGPGYSIIFLGLSFMFVALFVMNLLQARREVLLPTELIEGFEAHLNAKQFQEAYELASADESFLGKVLSAGLGKVSKGYEHAIEAMQEVGEDESMKIEHRLSYIALIGTVSPMVGLFGTVHGMIYSFQTIADAVGAPKPSELAAGVSTALFTTLLGLAIAIPAIAAFGILRNRFDRLELEVGIIGEGLMSRFQNAGKKQQPAT